MTDDELRLHFARIEDNQLEIMRMIRAANTWLWPQETQDGEEVEDERV